MLNKLKRTSIIAAATAGLLLAGGASAQADYTSKVEGGIAKLTSNQRTHSVSDTKADNNRIYSEYRQSNNTNRFQLVTKAYGETRSITVPSGVRVVMFKACVDKPLTGDGCGTAWWE